MDDLIAWGLGYVACACITAGVGLAAQDEEKRISMKKVILFALFWPVTLLVSIGYGMARTDVR